MLSIKNLEAGYGKVQVLHCISLEVPKGKVVTLIGSNGDKEITATQVATSRGTINYEVVCLLSYRIPREY